MSTPPLELPNPLTPMAFFAPDLARQITISHYVYISATVLVLWEMLNNVSADIRLVRQGYNLPVVAYFLSRFSTLAFLLGITILHTAPIGNCSRNSAILWLYPVQSAFTTLLFFVRVRAMYRNTRWATPFFLFLWVATTAASTTEAWQSTALVKDLVPTQYCFSTEIPNYTIVASIVPFINETLIFFAVTLRLASVSPRENSLGEKEWMRTAIFGDYLPGFTKAMLQDGQLYYLCVIVWYLLFLIFFYIQSLPAVFRWTVGVPGVALVNIMACRVYRNTKFGVYREATDAIILPTIGTGQASERRRTNPPALQPMTFNRPDSVTLRSQWNATTTQVEDQQQFENLPLPGEGNLEGRV